MMCERKRWSRRRLFSLVVDDVPLEGVLDAVGVGGFRFVVTPNLQHVVAVNREPELLECYRRADLSLCDSRVVALLARLLGKRITHVVPGSDLTRALFERGVGGDGEVMVVGATAEDMTSLKAKYGLASLVHYAPPMGFIKDAGEVEKVVQAVLANRPRYLFLAVGFPRQELLACMLKARGDFDCTAFCIGASIDFLTGKQRRAPVVWQRLHLEWFYRFLQQPRRLFRRYFVESWGILRLILREIKGGN